MDRGNWSLYFNNGLLSPVNRILIWSLYILHVLFVFFDQTHTRVYALTYTHVHTHTYTQTLTTHISSLPFDRVTPSGSLSVLLIPRQVRDVGKTREETGGHGTLCGRRNLLVGYTGSVSLTM